MWGEISVDRCLRTGDTGRMLCQISGAPGARTRRIIMGRLLVGRDCLKAATNNQNRDQ